MLYKLYSRVLLLLTHDCLDNLRTPQYAFRKSYQAHEIVFILRNLVEKAIEWNIPVFVLAGEIHKAYDNTRHFHIVASLQEKGVPRILVAAWMRE